VPVGATDQFGRFELASPVWPRVPLVESKDRHKVEERVWLPMKFRLPITDPGC
jgi:hypothetical protein